MNSLKKWLLIAVAFVFCTCVPSTMAFADEETQAQLFLSTSQLEVNTVREYDAPEVDSPDGWTISSEVWSSSNESVAKIDPQTGVIVPVADGTAKITVTVTFDGKADTQTAEYDVNVNLWNGLHTNEDGVVCLYKDGVVDTSATGIMKVDGQWLYLNEGQFQPDYNGVAKYSSYWWKITDGYVDFGYTGFAKNEAGWWYISSGKIDFSANGLIKWNGSWWYVNGGKIDFAYTGLYKYNGSWWYVSGGRINFSATGLCKYNGSWWYVSGGRVNFSATGLCKYNGSWWYVSSGRVNFNATGFAKYNGYWWRVVSGKVNFSASGIYKFNGYWWYTKGGHIDMSYNGVAQYNGYWWKFKNGYIDFKYTGLGRNQYGWWYVSGGRVNFNATGLCKYNGSWWYINNGKLDFNYNGLTRFNGSWWYVKGGYVRFDYTGTAEYGGSWWYVKSGRIDFSYNGDANVNGMSYHVSNGKVTGYASKLYTVTDPNSDMYGQTLKLYYAPSGELVEDVSDIIGSGHTYELHVNKTENIVTVYTTDGNVYVPVKRFICSNGGSNTPEGTFYSPDKYRWWELMGPCWGQWCTRITGGVLFHSVFYNSYQDPQSLSVRAYNKLGTTCSHGCVRLTAGDAKWIYDNCASGVKIVVYSKDGYEPFSKPTSYQLPSWHTWDPTDPTMYYKCQENGCH